MLRKGMFISDEQWELLGPLLERPRKSQYGRSRAGEREVFEAILFVLHTGIQWKHLPRTFPPKSTVHDYLKAWSHCHRITNTVVGDSKTSLPMSAPLPEASTVPR